MGNKTQPWFGAARRLSERSTDSYGLAVDKDGVTLGPDFPLIRKTSRGYETATLEELSCLREVVSLGSGDMPRLVGHLESIARALGAEDLAKARILALYLPINRLTQSHLDRLENAWAVLKGSFNPDEPRDERGRWTNGATNTQPSSAIRGARTREGTRARWPLASHPGVVRVQSTIPFETEEEHRLLGDDDAPFSMKEPEPRIEALPEGALEPDGEAPPRAEEEASPPAEDRPPQNKEAPPPAKEIPRATDEGPLIPYRPPRPGLTREECENAAERSRYNPRIWEHICWQVPIAWQRACMAANFQSVQEKKNICVGIFPKD